MFSLFLYIQVLYQSSGYSEMFKVTGNHGPIDPPYVTDPLGNGGRNGNNGPKEPVDPAPARSPGDNNAMIIIGCAVGGVFLIFIGCAAVTIIMR